MLPYTRGIILDNNYGIVKTETVFGFGSNARDYDDNINSSKPLEWIIAHGKLSSRSLKVTDDKPSELQQDEANLSQRSIKKKTIKKRLKREKKRKPKGKVNKCILKVEKKNKRGSNKNSKMHKRYMMPLILGLLAAKSLLIPIALKALAFISAKGLMMGFFSTVMASVLSLKNMFDHSHHYQNRKDDSKTQVEIIQVPTKTEDHVYYDEHYKRGDIIPVPPITSSDINNGLA